MLIFWLSVAPDAFLRVVEAAAASQAAISRDALPSTVHPVLHVHVTNVRLLVAELGVSVVERVRVVVATRALLPLTLVGCESAESTGLSVPRSVLFAFRQHHFVLVEAPDCLIVSIVKAAASRLAFHFRNTWPTAVRSLSGPHFAVLLFLVETPLDFWNGVIKTAAGAAQTFRDEDTRPPTFLAILRLNSTNLRSHCVLVVVLMEAPFDSYDGVVETALWMTQADVLRDAWPTALHTLLGVHLADCVAVVSALVTPLDIGNRVVKAASNSRLARLT